MPKPVPAQESFADLKFPLAGIDLSRGFGMQLPRPLPAGDYAMTTPVGNNVRAYEPGTQRARGGQRPGLKKYVPVQPGNGSSLIQELALVVGVGYTPPGPGGGLPYLTQTQATGTSGSATTVTFTSPVTAGNAIIVLSQGLDGYPTITDGGGNTYTTAVFNSVASSASRIFYCANVVGGFTTVTATFGGSVAHEVWAFEVGGLAASPKDGLGATAGSGGNSGGTLGTITTTAPPDFLFGVLGSTNATPTLTAPGWSIVAGSNPAFSILYTFQTAAVALAPSVVWSQSTNWTSALAAFKSV